VKPDPAVARPASTGLELRKGPPDGDLPAAVRAERERARKLGRALIVYEGATWCEPCTRFHQSAEAGDLDQVFANVTLLEFDRDRDGERMAAAGYVSKYIPLFVVPKVDGTSSGQQIEGSIKGDGAVAEITPRLKKLIASAR
jgi:hypothetical protein